MSTPKEKIVATTLAKHLKEGETLQHAAYGVKQPAFWIILLLMCLAILPGIIAVFFMTKNYLLGLTNKRIIILTVKGTSLDTVKSEDSIDLSQITPEKVKTKTGALFTHIEIQKDPKPFKAKFHRAFSETNRPEAIAMAQALTKNQ